MKTLELKKNLYWTGILDPNLRVFDIIMETEFGTTYNSYILKGSKKIALFETAKVKFFDEYIKEISQITDVKNIDYIIVNHTEPDHAGSVEKLIEMNPNIKIVGTAVAIGFLKNIVNRDFYSMIVRENDTLSLGDKTLHFMFLPNLHWPDTMYTYVEEDKVLFTCDSFGSHYSLDDILLSKVTDNEGYMRATKYYFDNIIGPFKPFMLKALDRIKDLEISMICTGHGPVIDCRIDEIKETYKKWCTVVNPNTKKTVIMPYVSAYGYTKQLAMEIARGIKASGDIDVRTYDMVESDTQKVLEELAFADGILFGTPTIVGEALKPIWDLTTSIFAGTHGGKLAGAFGSYGWSGEGVPHIIERLKQLRMKVIDDGFRIRFKPSEKENTEAYEYGYNFGCVLLNKENKKKSGKKQLVKCIVCGEIFDSSLETCPVCGVGRDKFVPVEVEETTYFNDTEESFVVIGNGIAGLSAATAIRERNKTCSITIVTNENSLTYNRPMLTKSMLADFEASQIYVHPQKWYDENNIKTLLSKEVKEISTDEKKVILSDMELKYDKLIYALGSESFVPLIKGKDKTEVVSIRRIEDTHNIIKLLPNVKNAVVIGGGVLGIEAAWELKKAKCNVTVLEVADKLMGNQLDYTASDFISRLMEEKGIKAFTKVQIEEIQGNEHVTGVKLSDGQVIPAELVIVSCGVRANIAVAKQAGIETQRAIVVNENMETNIKDIYACGDCAEFEGKNFALWAQGLEMGKVAGANAAGDELKYETIKAGLNFSGLNTELFALGDNGTKADVKYKTVEFNDPVLKNLEKYYFVNNRLSGVILIGDTSKMVELTEAVNEHKLFKDLF